jgi:hypothetical protein
MAAKFQFVMRAGPNTGKMYPLEAQEITIGRDSNNTVPINDPEISRKHARMELRGSAYAIQDLGSTNGTFVNGQRLSGIQVLNPGDSVSFGEGVMLTYEAIYDPNATVASSSAGAARMTTPLRRPAPASPAPQPTPAPVYSGQVPAGPLPEETPKKKGFPIWLLIVILLVIVICVCVAFFVIIDQLRLWCRVVPFLVPLLGGTCG